MGAALFFFPYSPLKAYEYSAQFEVQTPSTALEEESIKGGYQSFSAGIADPDRTPLGWSLAVRQRRVDTWNTRVLREDPEKNNILRYQRLSKLEGDIIQPLEMSPALIWNLPFSTHQLLLNIPLNDSDFSRRALATSHQFISPSRLYTLGYSFEASRAEIFPALIKRWGGENPLRKTPDAMYMHRHVVTGEGVVSSRLKLGTELSYVNRSGFRPEVWGTGLKGRYALSDRIYLGAGASYMRESRRDDPYDDQGYFSLGTTRMELSFEPVFDLLMSFAYTYIRESEVAAPHAGSDRTLRSDQYGFSLAYSLAGAQMNVASSFLRSEEGELQRQYSGGMLWTL